jgi:regulator of replication initiation timing
MTLLGKFLVVMQLVLSFLFLAFAGAVFTAQTNWRAATETARKNLADEQRKAADALTAKQTELDQLQATFAALDNEKKTLEGRAKALADENAALDADNKKLKQSVDSGRTIAELTSQEADERVKEAALQRARNAELTDSRNQTLALLNETRDQLFALELQTKQTAERYEQLLKDVGVMRAFLSSKDLTTDVKQMTVATAPPPALEGRIEEARKEKKGSRIFVTISLGSDDGLVTGHQLTVFRGDKYLGEVRLEEVLADQSVGVIVRTAPNSTIQAGDYVISKL